MGKQSKESIPVKHEDVRLRKLTLTLSINDSSITPQEIIQIINAFTFNEYQRTLQRGEGLEAVTLREFHGTIKSLFRLPKNGSFPVIISVYSVSKNLNDEVIHQSKITFTIYRHPDQMKMNTKIFDYDVEPDDNFGLYLYEIRVYFFKEEAYVPRWLETFKRESLSKRLT